MVTYSALLYKWNGVPVNIEEAKKYSKIAADLGSLDGMTNYCKFLQEGDLENDEVIEELARYCKMAADKGSVPVMYNYGLLLEIGKGVPQDFEKSLEYYMKTADEEFLPAISQCINMICMLQLSDKHIDKFKHYIKIGAELEDPFVMYKRSIELKYGFHEEEEDTEEAFELLKKKCH